MRKLSAALPQWIDDKPWLQWTAARASDVDANLNNLGDWSFRLSRNESFHSYPSTFVHAIPAALIRALGLRGELVVDLFGGTGQTAIEAAKCGCEAVTNDSNSIACLVAESRTNYLSASEREWIKSIGMTHCLSSGSSPSPLAENRGTPTPARSIRLPLHPVTL